ncbi:MAG: hypothetical protein HPY79_12000 [Bacteroidales bacterium]|nr:hypothetical protein [Bacteroidales bacterium]
MKQRLVLLGLLCIPLINFAQFNSTGPNWDKWGRTDAIIPGNNIKAIGIGNFTSFPRAALHVNANLLTPPTHPNTMFAPGELFRTDGPSGNVNAWRMFTGSGSVATEKFAVYVPAGSNHLMLQASAGDLRFNTGGANTRMTISGTTGFVGIGTNFTTPQALLHVNGTVRIDSLPADNTISTIVVTDSEGNLKSRDIKDLEKALAKIKDLEQKLEKLEAMIYKLTINNN